MPVKIIPLGGMEQIGMNITAIEYEDSIIVVDCGIAFPSEEMLGIDFFHNLPDDVEPALESAKVSSWWGI